MVLEGSESFWQLFFRVNTLAAVGAGGWRGCLYLRGWDECDNKKGSEGVRREPFLSYPRVSAAGDLSE